MPVIMFTAGEIVEQLVTQQRELSREIRALADLKERPLNPGEGVADRHHQIAKLGKRLAEAFDAFDTVMRGAAGHEAEVAAEGPQSLADPQSN